MKLFDGLVGETMKGVETEERLEVCHSLLLHLYADHEKSLSTKNNNLELAEITNVSQIEVKKAKKLLEENELIEIVKEDERESSIVVTTKGSFYGAKLKAIQLKEAMNKQVEPNSEDFVNPEMDYKFVEIYNSLSYKERVVYEATVASILCRDHYQSALFRTLGSILDAQAAEIMIVLTTLEDKGLIVLFGEKSTKIYLTNSKEFLLVHYRDFYNTNFVKNDHIYKLAFRYDEYSEYDAPYDFPDFEAVYEEEIADKDVVSMKEEMTDIQEVQLEHQSLDFMSPNIPTGPTYNRVFIIDTESLSWERFIQITANSILTEKDYYIAVFSSGQTGGLMPFELFNYLMKLPCRGETDQVSVAALYYQFFTIQIMQAIQLYPNSEIIVLTNESSYSAIAHQLQTKFNLKDNQIQIMGYQA